MLILLPVFFPMVLLGGVLAMERLERQFADQTVGESVLIALLTAPADDVEELVTRDAAAALNRHWKQQTRRARLASASPFLRG
jgi:hypothetical protein